MSMKGLFLFVTVLATGLCGAVYAEDPGDLLRINLSREVVVGDKILPTGTWEIRWVDNDANPTIKVYRENAVNAEVITLSIPTQDNKKVKTTEAVIEKIGPDYFLTQIWIQGERTGYQLRLPNQIASLKHEDMQRIPATFVSSSRFARGAEMEGQARTHTAQGLGGPDDRYLNGVAIARAYTPTLSEDVAVALNAPIPSLPEAVEPGPAEIAEPQVDAPSNENAVAQAEPVPSPVVSESAQVEAAEERAEERAEEQAKLNEPEPAVDVSEPQLAQNNEAPALPETQVSSFQEPQGELAEVIPPQLPSVDESPAESSDFDRELPATASNWLEFALIGGVLVGLAFAVRWG